MAKDHSIRLRVTVAPGSMLHDDLLKQHNGGHNERLLSLAHMGLAFLRLNPLIPAQQASALPAVATVAPSIPMETLRGEIPQQMQPLPNANAVPSPADFNPLVGANLDALGAYDGS
jgi:hypothetical protein